MNAMWRQRLFNIFGALLYGAAYYGWVILCATINRLFLPSPWIGVLEYTIWVCLDLLFEARLPTVRPERWKLRLFLAYLRWLIAFPLFYTWSTVFLDPPYMMAFMQSHVTHVTRALLLFPAARPSVAVVLLIVYVLMYAVAWGWLRRGRFALGVLVPIAFSGIMYLVFYTSDFGGYTLENLPPDPAVQVIYPMPNKSVSGSIRTRLFNPYMFPRCLYHDKQRERLYMSLGALYGVTARLPNLLSVATDGSGYQETVVAEPGKESFLIREFQPAPSAEDLYLIPWDTHHVFEVRKDELHLAKMIPYTPPEKIVSMFDILHDEQTNRLYAAMGFPPMFQYFDLNTGQSFVLNLEDEGLAEYGTVLHILRLDRRNNRLYCIAVAGDKMAEFFELDPDSLTVTRTMTYNDVLVSLEIDKERNELLLGAGLSPYILVVDPYSLTVKRKIPTPVPVIRRIIVCPDRDSYLITDHLHGRLLELSRRDGGLRRAYVVGNKPLGMARDGDIVYVASTLGFIKVTLDPPPVRIRYR